MSKADYTTMVREAYEPHREDSHVWVQWKGTDVCVDIHCVCGSHGHYDGYQMYLLQCGDCGRKFAVQQNIPLIELTEQQIADLEEDHWQFVVGEKDAY